MSVAGVAQSISGPAPVWDYGLLKMFFSPLLPQCFRFTVGRRETGFFREEFNGGHKRENACGGDADSLLRGTGCLSHAKIWDARREAGLNNPTWLLYSVLCWNNTDRMCVVVE